MNCRNCKGPCIKKGMRNSMQRYRCINCGKYQQKQYIRRAYYSATNADIVRYLKEGCDIRSIARLLEISPGTVIKRIKQVASKIKRPFLSTFGKDYEVDEIRTFIGNKRRLCWIAYAIRKDTGEVVDFRVGRRTNKTLRGLISTLILARAVKIYTDGLSNYRYLIRKSNHKVTRYGTNGIERMNLTLRTHLKRLNRRTICYSRSLSMLSACLKIYFWGLR